MRLRNVKNASVKIDSSNYIIKDYENYKGNYKSIFNNDKYYDYQARKILGLRRR